MAPITMRPPTFYKATAPAEYKNPSISWLTETWRVTHSTLPMWQTKRNVCIQYTPLEPSDASVAKDNTDRLNDLVSYQNNNGTKIWWVHGVNRAASSGDSRGEWDWRGQGMLKIAGSHWEILGHGEEETTGNKWMVIMFAKTIFTPAGIDIFSRDRSGLQTATLEDIKESLAEVDDEEVKSTASNLFEVNIDDARKDEDQAGQAKTSLLGLSITS